MTPDLTNLELRIDRDRREQEALLLAYLLTLSGRTRRQVYAALRVEADPLQAASDILAGNANLGLRSPAPVLANRLATAAMAGYARTLLVLPGPTLVDSVGEWLSTAAQYLAKMLQTLQRRLALAIYSAPIARRVPAAKAAFVAGGYINEAKGGAWALRSAATTMVANAYYGGWWMGFSRPEAIERVTGFRYSAVLDNVTTTICRAYHGVQLPPSDPWWLTHWPSNHFSCRANVLPLFRAFTPTENPPYVPAPFPGFGRAPVGMGGVLIGRGVAA